MTSGVGTVERVGGLSDDFIFGADVSSVLSLEESGVVFRDADGEPSDLFVELARAGWTDVRVRVWNDPYDERGRGYGGGTVDVPRAVEIGRRATAAGLKVLVNFHYSDFWADPLKQQAPKAWEGLGVSEKADRLFAFTREALARFREAGVAVTMVQVGNETNGAMSGVTGWADLSTLLRAGVAAVRAELPDARVALHFANPEIPGFYEEASAAMAQHGVDYDVFASSYYPFWHGSLENLARLLTHVRETYGKDVVVMETSWPYTFISGDGFPVVVDQTVDTSRYEVSVAGQIKALRDIVALTHEVGGLGVYYWEPAWLPVGPASQYGRNQDLWQKFGSGWATSYVAGYEPREAGRHYGGATWDNQALFDFEGRPLESLYAPRYAREGNTAG